MTHTYRVTGMTCAGCEYKVQHLLAQVAGVTAVRTSFAHDEATVDMAAHVPTPALQAALHDYPKYHLTDAPTAPLAAASPAAAMPDEADDRSWWQTYRPLLVLAGYLTAVALVVGWRGGTFALMPAMNAFMAGFFLAFSFFKLLDLRGFADSYAMYDVVAKQLPAWGFVYPFVELALGLAFATGVWAVATNAATLVVMGVSLVGVLQSVLNGRKIQCACLGAVFNLPMSTVTIVEDALMMAMSGAMLLMLQ